MAVVFGFKWSVEEAAVWRDVVVGISAGLGDLVMICTINCKLLY